MLVFPAFALLLRLTLAGKFRGVDLAVPEDKATKHGTTSVCLHGRLAIACLLAGSVLLNLADATWAQTACLSGFVAPPSLP